MQESCLFCKILKGQIPSQKVFENETTYAFRDISPQAKEHILVIPKKHIESLAHLNDEGSLGDVRGLQVISDLYSSVFKITQQLGIHRTGYRTVINTGAEGGQTVFHLHVHILGGEFLNGKFG